MKKYIIVAALLGVLQVVAVWVVLGYAPAKTAALATVDPTGSRMESESPATFTLHVFFSDRSGSLHCSGNKVPNKPAMMTCYMTPEGEFGR